MFGHLLRARFLGTFHPVFVSWMITDRCNLSCMNCGRNRGIAGDAGDELLARICGQAAAHSVWKINLTGGEPLLHPRIEKIISDLKQVRVRLSLNTNGLLITQRIDLLANVNSVCISLDGRPETHDSIRGTGTYDAVRKGLETLRSRGIPARMTCTIGRKTTVDDLEAVMAAARHYGAPVNFQPGRETALGAGRTNPEAPDKENYIRIMERLIELKRENLKLVANSFMGLRHLMHWPEDRRVPCGAARFFCRIDPCGNIHSCSNSTNDAPPVGNIMYESLVAPFRGRSPVHCAQCWSGDRVEANLIFALRVEPALNYIRTRSRQPVSPEIQVSIPPGKMHW